MEIKKIRRQKHITLDMMSYRSGISVERYLEIENSNAAPTDIELRKIAVALDVKPDELE